MCLIHAMSSLFFLLTPFIYQEAWQALRKQRYNYMHIPALNNLILRDQKWRKEIRGWKSPFKYHYTKKIIMQILFRFRLLHNIEQCFPFYTVGLCLLPILNTAVCIRIWKRRDTCICITESLYCIPETTRTLLM